MMIKITEHCSMGCTHCMNKATPNNKHMDFQTFRKAIDFQRMYGGPFVIITGGEPTEHPMFKEFLKFAILQLKNCFFTITTNGLWLQNQSHYAFVKNLYDEFGTRITFQVTNDERYYPIRIDFTHPVFELENVIICDKLEHIYPQGRALDNNLEWDSKGSKCFNVRAITHQVKIKDLRMVFGMLAAKGKFCTPHINIDGYIKLGESDLCPNCSHIDKSNDDIVNDILAFRCSGCSHVNNNLPESYRKIIGED